MLRLLPAILSLLLASHAALAGSNGIGGTGGNSISVPEPASLAVLGAGIGALLLYRRHRGK